MRLTGVEDWRSRFGMPPLVLQNRVAILMYHRVADVDSDPWSLWVSRRHFAQHIEHVRNHYS